MISKQNTDTLKKKNCTKKFLQFIKAQYITYNMHIHIHKIHICNKMLRQRKVKINSNPSNK